MKNQKLNNVFIIVVVVLAPTLSIGIALQPPTAEQFSMSHRILLDNSEGNTMGWNLNRMSFIIFDNQFNPETSTVIVNTF